MTTLYYLPQYFTTLLNVGGGITDSQTTGIIIQSVAGLDITKPGIACLSYTDPLDTSIAEWITYTSIDGSNELQGVTRGAEGYSAKAHSNLVTVAFPISKSHINNINDTLASLNSTTTITSSATPTPTGDKKRNELYITALAADAEIQAPSGTPANGNIIMIRIKDDGTARALTYNAIYRAVGITLPTTTTISKTLYIGAVYNSADSKWDCLATGVEA